MVRRHLQKSPCCQAPTEHRGKPFTAPLPASELSALGPRIRLELGKRGEHGVGPGAGALLVYMKLPNTSPALGTAPLHLSPADHPTRAEIFLSCVSSQSNTPLPAPANTGHGNTTFQTWAQPVVSERKKGPFKALGYAACQHQCERGQYPPPPPPFLSFPFCDRALLFSPGCPPTLHPPVF